MISECKSRAKTNLSKFYGEMLGAYLLMVLIMGALSGTGIGVLLLGGALTLGYNRYLLSYACGGKPAFERIFDGFNDFSRALVAYLLQQLFTFLWSMLFIIPGIIKAYSYSATLYILNADSNISGSEAIDLSRKIMNGKKGELFCLDLSFIGWFLLSMITFGLVWIFYAGPYYVAAKAEFMNELLKENKVGVYGKEADASAEAETENTDGEDIAGNKIQG